MIKGLKDEDELSIYFPEVIPRKTLVKKEEAYPEKQKLELRGEDKIDILKIEIVQ